MKGQMSARYTAGTLTFTLAALAAFAVPTTQAKTPPRYHAKQSLLGCWTLYGPHQPSQPFRSRVRRCFAKDGTISGVTVEGGGEGSFLSEHWHLVGQNLKILDENTEQECLFRLSDDRQLLILSNCRAAGEWQSDKR